MKALRFTEFGPPSVLRIEEVAIPEPGEEEALVQVKSSMARPATCLPPDRKVACSGA
jgi:NADPH:quinone reductase-like Zn-dependent oxidoreductase